MRLADKEVAKRLYKLSFNKKPIENVWTPDYITIKGDDFDAVDIPIKIAQAKSTATVTASDYCEMLSISEPSYEIIKIKHEKFVVFLAIDSYKLILSIEYILKVNERLDLQNTYFVMLDSNNKFQEVLLNKNRKKIENLGNFDFEIRPLFVSKKDEVLSIFDNK